MGMERFVLVAALAACSSPDLAGTTWSCRTDADCTEGKVCASTNGVLACVTVPDGPIRIGMSGPLQGPSEDLGIEMRRGIQALFARVNAEGGVFGREITLTCLNDSYDPVQAVENTKQLLDIRESVAGADSPDVRGPNGVFALLGNIGTPTMLETAPLATKNRVVFFAPFTGSQRYLRDGTNSPYVYNFRAGYYQETEAMLDYIASYRQPRIVSDPPGDSYRRILAFTQRDSYGDAGYNGLINAYNRLAPLPQPDSTQPEPSIARLYYDRENVASVDPAILEAEQLLSELIADGVTPRSVAILMVDTYQPGNKFIRGIKDWINADLTRATLLDLEFMHVSFVGSNALAAALTSAPESYLDIRDGSTRRAYAEGVLVTQVVPYYLTQALGVSEYRADLDAFDGGAYTFNSLEGYVAARLFVRGLEINGPELDGESLRQTLDNRVSGIDIGIGTLLGFSPVNHQASHAVWGSVIQADGSFRVPFVWNPTDRIVPN